MNWTELRKNDEILNRTEEIWKIEEKFPKVFRDASKLPTLADFHEFVEKCELVFGLFDKQRLCACVYVEERATPRELLIHLSILEKMEPEHFIKEAADLRDWLLKRGVRTIRGWILQKNRSLAKILNQIGFIDTQLIMRSGMSHGRVLKWTMVELRRG